MSGRLVKYAFQSWAALLSVGLVVSLLWQGGGVLAAKVSKEKAEVSATAQPIDPFVVEWFATKAKEKADDLGKPKGTISRVISVTGEKGFLQEFEQGVIVASRHGVYTVTGETYKQWKPRSGLKPYEFPKK